MSAVQMFLRPLANPLPLGFLALGAATLLVSGLQLGWLEPADGAQVGMILIAFVFPLQLVVSVFGFLARDVVAATGMGILAGTWLSVGLIQLTGEPGSTSDALGMLLLFAATAMLIPAAGASTGKLAAFAVLGTTALRFAVTGVYELTAGDGWKTLAGIVGLVLCVLAVYAALAMALEDVLERTVLPIGRRDPIDGEPGVRGQL
jgi:succinate-acetate transporter protein